MANSNAQIPITDEFYHPFTSGVTEKHGGLSAHVPPQSNLKGRPRAIPEELEPVVKNLLLKGYGYKSVARILREDYGLNLDWSRVRDFKKGKGAYSKRGGCDGF